MTTNEIERQLEKLPWMSRAGSLARAEAATFIAEREAGLREQLKEMHRRAQQAESHDEGLKQAVGVYRGMTKYLEGEMKQLLRFKREGYKRNRWWVEQYFAVKALREMQAERDAARAQLAARDREIELLRTAAITVARGFEDGVFVRDTRNDGDSAWAIKLLPYLRALAVLDKGGEGK